MNVNSVTDILVGSVGPAPVMISGTQGLWWHLDDAESIILNGWRLLRSTGAGSLAVELQHGKVTRWNVSPDLGGPKLLNEALGVTKLRD